MKAARLLLLSLGVASTTLVNADTVPALTIGSTTVALSDLISLKFDNGTIQLLQTDGSALSLDLAEIQFSSLEASAAIGSISNATNGQYRIYDLAGRLVKQGNATTDTEDILSGLTPATYLISLNGSTQKVHYGGGTLSAAVFNVETTALTDYVTTSATRAMTAKATALEIDGADIAPQCDLSRVDSLTFSLEPTTLHANVEGTVYDFNVSDLTGLSFPSLSSTVTLAYSESSVSGINPLYFDGVSIEADGAGVTVNSTYDDEVEYELSGESTQGYFKIYSSKKWQTTLKGLTLTNPNGPAINSQTGKKGTIKSQNGYTNTLCDGTTYAESDEDQKGCIFSEGQLIFSGKGTLNVTSLYKHAICSDDYVSFENGVVNVLSAASDAVHANDSVLVQSGTITLNAKGDGIDCDGSITVREGENGTPTLSITTTSDGVKGIKTGTDFLLTAGNVTISQSGASVTSDSDTDYVIGIKASGNITIKGGSLTITSSATDGRGLSADGNISIDYDSASVSVSTTSTSVIVSMTGAGGKGIKADGTFTMGSTSSTTDNLLVSVTTTGARSSSTSTTTGGGFWGGGRPGGGGMMPGSNTSTGKSAKAIKAEGTVTINGGRLNVSTAQDGAEGLESKTSIAINGGVQYLKCYDDCINSSGVIAFNGGYTVCHSTGNDAIDSNYTTTGAITIAGGNVFAYTTRAGVEMGMDCDTNNRIVIKNGIVVTAGGSQGGLSNTVGSSAQKYYLGTVNASYSTARYYTLFNTSGTAICTFHFNAACSCSYTLFTAPTLGSGTFTVKYGTTAPTASSYAVDNHFYIAPTVSTTGTLLSLTSK